MNAPCALLKKYILTKRLFKFSISINKILTISLLIDFVLLS